MTQWCLASSSALGAEDRATIDIGLMRSVERRGGVRIGLALGVLHSIRRRLMMKQPPNGLWGVGSALRAGSSVLRFVARAGRFARCTGRYTQRCRRKSTLAPVVAMRKPT